MRFNAGGLSDGQLLGLYNRMLEIREVEKAIAARYAEQQMKTPVHSCLGQEATSVGVCATLGKDDYVFSNHRGHGHYLAKNGDLKAMIAELYNRETGCSRGRGGSMHLIDLAAGLPGSSAIVAGGIPLAVGSALAFSMRGEKRVSVAFFGDGAVEEGALYESINFAMLKALPVIFVCENNSYAVCSPLSSRQINGEIYKRFSGLNIPSSRVDGNNVLDVFNAATRAVERARVGGGPFFIECVTFRLHHHVGPITAIEVGYSSEEEYSGWVKRCPVANYENFLLDQGILMPAKKSAIEDEIAARIDDAFKFAQESPLPAAEDLFRGLYQ